MTLLIKSTESKGQRNHFPREQQSESQSYQINLPNCSTSHDQTSNNQSLENLNLAKQRFETFVESLKSQRNTPLRQDVIAHYEHNEKAQKYIQISLNSDVVLKFIITRIQKMQKNKKIKKNWSEQDILILIWLVSKYSDQKLYESVEKDLTEEDWEFIAKLIPGVSAESCMFKWLSLKKINLATNSWSEMESTLLANIVRLEENELFRKKSVKDWKKIAQLLYKQNQDQQKTFRSPKQCKEHWSCYLNPNLKKGPWKPEEDIKLMKKIIENHGAKKWTEIVQNFDGRTQNALKNRYNLIAEKLKRSNRGKSQFQLIKEYLEKCEFKEITKMEPKQSEGSRNEEQCSLEEDRKDLDGFYNYSDVKLEVKVQQNSYTYTTIHVATPVKVEKFNLQFFANYSKSFFKCIQPGVINADGSFSEIKNNFVMRKNP